MNTDPELENLDQLRTRQIPARWKEFMRYCAELGHGEIEKLKIQDGVPVMAEIVREKVKFT